MNKIFVLLYIEVFEL